MAVETVVDNLGNAVPISSYPQTFTYNGSNVATITATAPGTGIKWVQTYTYSGAQITAISQWVRQ